MNLICCTVVKTNAPGACRCRGESKTAREFSGAVGKVICVLEPLREGNQPNRKNKK